MVGCQVGGDYLLAILLCPQLLLARHTLPLYFLKFVSIIPLTYIYISEMDRTWQLFILSPTRATCSAHLYFTVVVIFRIFNGKEHDAKLCIPRYFLPSVKSTDAKRYISSMCMNIHFPKIFHLNNIWWYIRFCSTGIRRNRFLVCYTGQPGLIFCVVLKELTDFDTYPPAYTTSHTSTIASGI
jgi:hypothetical protein